MADTAIIAADPAFDETQADAAPAPISDADLREFAASLSINRRAFEEIYDRLVGMGAGRSAFKLVAFDNDFASNTPDSGHRDHAHIAAALIAAQNDGWLAELMLELYETVAQALDDAPKKMQFAVMKSAISVYRTFADGSRVADQTIAASRRCCSISEITDASNGQTKQIGSGFLIGADLVLTNFHVIEGQVDVVDGVVRPRHDAELLFRFGHYPNTSLESTRNCGLARDWLVASSLKIETFQNVDQMAENLDYAVIRLHQQPGHVVGWYDHSKWQWINHADDPILALQQTDIEVWQFPRAQPMKVATGKLFGIPAGLVPEPPPEPARPPRYLHNAPTNSGSSGSLVVRASDMEPIALHTGQTERFALDDGSKGRLKFAVPLAMIFAQCGETVSAALAASPRKLSRNGEGAPIIGRAETARIIRAMIPGTEYRIFRIITRPDPETGRIKGIGRTFTFHLMKALIDPHDHHPVLFSAALIASNDALITARRLVERVNPGGGSNFTTVQSGKVMDKAATRQLAEDTLSAMRRVVGDKTIWIMIDDLDKHTIKAELAASNYLMELYRRADAGAKLRFVLVGLEGQLEGLPSDHLATEFLNFGFDARETGDWIEGNLASGSWPKPVAEKMSKMVWSAAGVDAPSRHVVDFIATHAMSAFGQKADDA